MAKKSLDHFTRLFQNQPALLLKSLHGLEKESIRTSLNGAISEKRHPHALGAPLFSPHYTLDFGEAQTEFVSKPFSSIQHAYEQMKNLHQFAYKAIDEEVFWMHSAPPRVEGIEQIKLASFGDVQTGYDKYLYRLGLAHRFRKMMQMLSGVHYNFSWKNEFWQFYQQKLENKLSLEEFTNAKYLHLIRNYLRYGWLCGYLFGASPILDRTYCSKFEEPLLPWLEHSAYAPFATSIRMSRLGYFSKIQKQLHISFNSLKAYLTDLSFALKTSHPFYQKLGLFHHQKAIQMNTHFLQIEAEHYTRIRPKANPSISKRPIEALQHGIHYFEVRNIDLCPSHPMGIDLDMLKFLNLFFIYCLAKESPPIEREEGKIICSNQNEVALFGRRPSLKLIDMQRNQKISLKKWATEILREITELVHLTGQCSNQYQKILQKQMDKVKDSNLTPSAKQLQAIFEDKSEFADFVLEKSKAAKQTFLKCPLKPAIEKKLVKLNAQSWRQQAKAEAKEEDVLPGFQDLEFSTQMVLREAIKRGYRFDILDRSSNFVRIHTPHKSILVKQATLTPQDSLTAFFAMENKFVTQTLLKEANLAHTHATLFNNAREALDQYECFSNQKIVIKANHSNMGESVYFIEPRQKNEFKKVVLAIEQQQDQILIEPFFQATEYRFLVVKDRVVAIAHRVPAHVVGDGRSSIKELIDQKNIKNAHRRQFQAPLQLTIESRRALKEQELNPSSILKKNQKVSLRYNSNVSTGGESIDVTDKVHPGYVEQALLAARSLKARICGVDMLIKNRLQKPTNSNHAIIELNHNPALYLHRCPNYGTKRYVEKEILDFLVE